MKSFKLFILAFLILIQANGAFAQNVEQQVAHIRQIVVETNKHIDAGLKDRESGMHYAAWTIGGARDGMQWGAVGTMHSTDEFYFDCEPVHLEDCETTDIRNTVRKIVSAYSGAADLRTRSEYFFTENTGELIFVFTTELEADKRTTERRFYFSKGKLIRINQAGKNTDAKFSAEDLEKADEEMQAAKGLRDIFAQHLGED